MKDFAWWLNYNRERVGLNQAQLAELVGQSGAYISMLESRRKPPPSDEVVRKIARALGVDEDRLLEVAHLERTPPDIQRRFLDLDRKLEFERRTHESLVERLLPAALYPLLGGAEELAGLPLSRTVLRRLGELVAPLKSIREYEAFAQAAVDLYRRLDDRDRDLLLDLAGALRPGAERPPPAAAAAGARQPVFLDVPAGPVADSLAEASGWRDVPARDSSPSRYCLIATGNENYPRIEHGDYVIVDEDLAPENGDLVAVLESGRGLILRYLALGSRVELAPLNPQHPPLVLDQSELEGDGARVRLRGVVVGIVRDLK